MSSTIVGADPGRPANRLDRPLDQVLDDAPASWREVVETWRGTPAGRQLCHSVEARRAGGATIFPRDVLRALAWTPRPQVRVVILGQDPYHGPGQAEGLAFSVPAGQRLPPSLRNILSELHRDLGLPMAATGHLGPWARQGVLLLNTCLTVEADHAGSHARLGWEPLTDAIVAAVAGDPGPKVFMLWGAHAQAKATLIESAGPGRHLVLQANHPSPLSARRPPIPFVGCGHFSQAQAFLSRAEPHRPPIDWGLVGAVADGAPTLL